jgi:hypothetical protein
LKDRVERAIRPEARQPGAEETLGEAAGEGLEAERDE